ncbi:MAG: signal peptidase I [Nanoarchaeota archaeon]|nr:signal peptidase I [Nanoarchaeota archaeon]
MVSKTLRDKIIVGVVGTVIGSGISLPFALNMGIGRADGPCMIPKILDGDIYLIEEFPGVEKRAKKGEVVISVNPEGEQIVKRLAGTPGDTVYVPFMWYDVNQNKWIKFAEGKRVLNKGEYWVLGDNSEDSFDSRFYGPVREIRGRLLLVYSPTTKTLKTDF